MPLCTICTLKGFLVSVIVPDLRLFCVPVLCLRQLTILSIPSKDQRLYLQKQPKTKSSFQVAEFGETPKNKDVSVLNVGLQCFWSRSNSQNILTMRVAFNSERS